MQGPEFSIIFYIPDEEKSLWGDLNQEIPFLVRKLDIPFISKEEAHDILSKALSANKMVSLNPVNMTMFKHYCKCTKKPLDKETLSVYLWDRIQHI